MCKSPGILADGTQIACRNCSLCHRRARNDWIGRCIAESKTAKACHVINLTYGRNRHGDVLHERSVLLTYSDIQKFLKLLRRHGYPVRYLVTGEYGNEKGRAHWHIILFWQDKVPPFAGWSQYGEWLQEAEEEQRFNWVRLDDGGDPAHDSEGNPLYFWPHGFAYWQPVNQRTVQYVCWYVLKEMDGEGRQYHLAMSKKPPIGQAYFEQLAERHVDAGIAPQTPEYRFPGVTRRKKAGGREVIPFWLKGRPLELYLGHYIATWAERKGDQPRPKSELVDLYEEWGRVVHDEYAVAERASQERQADLKAMIKERGQQVPRDFVPTKTAEDMRRDRKELARDRWEFSWIMGASSEQERQSRQQVIDEQREHEWEQLRQNRELWLDWLESLGWSVDGAQWISPSGEPGEPSDQGFDEWKRQRAGECLNPTLDSHSERPDYGTGPVGTYNRNYGPGPGEGAQS